MDLRVLVAYRHLFGAAFLLPVAFFVERKTRPAITWTVLIQSFFCGLFGGTLAQNLYLMAIKLTTATFTTAIANLIPAITFVLAVIFGLEKLGLRTMAGKAKLAGTAVGLGGAMFLTFYKGPEVDIWPSNVDLLQEKGSPAPAHLEYGNRVMGSLLAVVSCFSYAIWLIIQAKMIKCFPCANSSAALMCLMAAVQSAALALCMQRDWNEWKMGLDIRLLTSVYVVRSDSVGVDFNGDAWCIRLKGPLFASVFNPLMLVVVAVLGSFLLEEKLHLGGNARRRVPTGCLLGAILIVVGLYLVIWGKCREAKKAVELPVVKPQEPGQVEVTTQAQSTGR
ncbi:unnamed protein product [Spirodela intermedia]|uniref:WAT1-related protein n=1 Tax=Spirodela intermedia TaxID=51605 RepID=A0A7I8IRP2_SPIIN|nr:unnamed protein product [Spirodela intermedia]CAA6660534.1 unnamed protein product [Spirodela intermedia]